MAWRPAGLCDVPVSAVWVDLGGDAAMIEMPTTWSVDREGLHIWRGGVEVALIGFGHFGALVYDLVRAMR
jgi:hypothetical protein